MSCTKLAVSSVELQLQEESAVKPERLKFESVINFDDVIGFYKEKQKMEQIFCPKLSKSKLESEGEISTTKMKSPAVLFFGPPGVGKTYFMLAVASQYKISSFWMRPSEILSKWEGQTEKNIFAVLTAAKKAAEESGMAIICLDHADLFLGARYTDHTWTSIQNALFEAIDGPESSSKVVWLAAAFYPDLLDPKFVSYFTEKIFVRPPDFAARKLKLERGFALRNLKLDESFSNELVKATNRFTFRELDFFLMEITCLRRERLMYATHWKQVKGPGSGPQGEGRIWKIAHPKDWDAIARTWQEMDKNLTPVSSVSVYRDDIRQILKEFKTMNLEEALEPNLEFHILHNGVGVTSGRAETPKEQPSVDIGRKGKKCIPCWDILGLFH